MNFLGSLFDGLYADLSAEKHHDKNPGLRHGARDSGDRFISVDITREHDAHPCGRERLDELFLGRALAGVAADEQDAAGVSKIPWPQCLAHGGSQRNRRSKDAVLKIFEACVPENAGESAFSNRR
jgi:hypothetical protein